MTLEFGTEDMGEEQSRNINVASLLLKLTDGKVELQLDRPLSGGGRGSSSLAAQFCHENLGAIPRSSV